MAIPDYESLMKPLLETVSDGREQATRELTEHLADQFELTEEERQERLPSGQQTYLSNRVGWGKTYLVKAGLLESPRRGFVRISDEGMVHEFSSKQCQ